MRCMSQFPRLLKGTTQLIKFMARTSSYDPMDIILRHLVLSLNTIFVAVVAYNKIETNPTYCFN